MEFFEECQDSEPAPSWPGPASGRPFWAHAALAGARPSHPCESRQSRDPATPMPETLQGPRRPLALSQDALAASDPLGWGSSGRGPCVLSLYSPRLRLKAPPTTSPDFWGKGLGWGPEVGSPSPPRPPSEGPPHPVLSSDAGSTRLPFPVVSSVRQTLSTPGGALPPRLPPTSASLVKSPELAGKARELCRGNRHDSSPSALILS